MTLAACTIVSKNYLPFARVLADSFLEHHPEGRIFVLLVDRVDGYFNPAKEKFTLIQIEELENLPDLAPFLFKYTILEANTAVKPFFLQYLFARYTLTDLVYFDPDIEITGSLDDLAACFEHNSIVLTPHLTDPIDDHAHPGELAVLQAGTYNLGFIALRRGEVAERLLLWWQDRLYDRCVVRIEDGLFVDQKWIDLVPGMFQDVHILNDPGYNVAYWNLHGRRVEFTGDTAQCDEIRVNGRPLVFFHYSGIDPADLHHVSKHQDRFVLTDLGAAASLYRRYSDLLVAAGYHELKPWPYAFGSFSNGVAIPDAARRLYLDFGPRRQRFGDPFQAADEGSFFAWLNEPRKAGGGPSLSRLLGHLYASRPDLVRLFPEVDGRDYLDFCAWLDDFGRHELKLDESFLEGALKRAKGSTRLSTGTLKRQLKSGLKRAYHSELGKKSRFYGKRLLGHERYGELRQRLRKDVPAPSPSTPMLPLGGYRLPVPERLEAPGVNLVGYFEAETGMGEAARSLARAFAKTGIATTRQNLDLNVLARQGDTTFGPQDSDFRYSVNLFVINADQVVPVYEHLGPEIFAGRFNIGFWLWELETFPEAWRGAFDLLHEVWTPSSFCVDAISKLSPIPVRRMPIPVEISFEESPRRADFGLPDRAFIFLFMFNYLSYFERKNPLALLRAFKKAFPKTRSSSLDHHEVLLVLKTSQSDFAPEARRRVRNEIRGAPVVLIDEYYERAAITKLTALADCYVSLHRSEGFGLTLAEAMLLEKPVIATAYSGNTDFFNLNNGYPVRYRLVELADHAGPYPARARWAEPDLDHAARLLRQVLERRDEAAEVARRAREDIGCELSYASVAEKLEQRFEELLGQLHRHGRSGRPL